MRAAHLLPGVWVAAITVGGLMLGGLSGGPPHVPAEWPLAAEGVAAYEAKGQQDRHPAAVRAEAIFFRALNQDTGRRAEAIRSLTAAVAADPADGTTNLWLGMAHLWTVAETGGEPWTLLDSAILARHSLARAVSLRQDDSRIPSWLSAIELFIAEVERDEAAAAAAEASLAKVFDQDPTFHAVSLGIIRWESQPDSAAFAQGLAAMRLATKGASDDPSAINTPRWPHNVEGFLLAAADYELKAGHRQRAAVLLNVLREGPGYESWPYRHLAEERLESLQTRARLYADDDPANDPPYILERASGVGCVVCHQGGGG